MRDIREIIEELREHPDLISDAIFTMDDIIYELNGQLQDINCDGITELNYNDLTDKDIEVIRENLEEKIEILWDSIDFYLIQLPDLKKKLKRDIKISKILKNKNEI